MTTEQASKLTGWSVRFIREMCKNGTLGTAFCKGKGYRYKCVPFPGRIADALGISIEELERRINDIEREGT